MAQTREEENAKRRETYHKKDKKDVEIRRQKARESYYKHKEDYKAAKALYAKKNQQKANERARASAKERRKIILEHYGHKCTCCGETNSMLLALDHINNDGKEHRKRVGVSEAFTRWVIKNNFPDNLQLLCHNCNSAKSFYGACPHTKLDIKNLDDYFGSLILASANSKVDAVTGNWDSNW